MAPKAATAATAFLFINLLITYIPSQSASTCSEVDIKAMATVCLPVLTSNSKPSSACCSAISAMHDVGVCLCDARSRFNITVDANVTLQLLGLCADAKVPTTVTCS